MAFQPAPVYLGQDIQLEDKAALRKLHQDRLLNEAFNSSLVTEADPNNPNARVGDIDPRKFYGKAKELGLDPDSAAAALAWKQKQYQTVSGMSDIADTMAAKRPGFDINQSLGRAGAQFGDQQPQYREIPQTEAPQAPKVETGVAVPPPVADKSRASWDSVGAAIGMKPKAAAPVAQDPNAVQVPGQVQGTNAASFQLPELPPQPQTSYFAPPAPDQRTFDEAAMDKYMALPFGGVQTAPKQAADRASDPLFQWAPADDGSNAYRQYSSALSSQLKAAGYDSPSAYLGQVYDSARDSHLKPVPQAMLLGMGPEGRKTYYQMLSERQQSEVEADALGRKAVLDARNALTEQAQKFGVSTVEQRKTEMPEGLLLRDPAKRAEAAAALTNRENVKYAQQAVADAGMDTTKLSLALPQVVRAYATALNPGQQLSEGNMQEVARQMYPEQLGNKEIMAKAMFALARFFKNGDTSGMQQLSDSIDASDPRALAARLGRLAQESEILNAKTLSSYVVGPERGAPAKAAAPQDSDQANDARYSAWQRDQQRQFEQSQKPKRTNWQEVGAAVGKNAKQLSAEAKRLRAGGF